VESEDTDPGAHNAAVESGEVGRRESAGGNQVGQVEFRKIGHVSAGVEGTKNEIVVTAGGETGSTAVEGAAVRIVRDGVGVGEGSRASQC
jgi:hypothetical protein